MTRVAGGPGLKSRHKLGSPIFAAVSSSLRWAFARARARRFSLSQPTIEFPSTVCHNLRYGQPPCSPGLARLRTGTDSRRYRPSARLRIGRTRRGFLSIGHRSLGRLRHPNQSHPPLRRPSPKPPHRPSWNPRRSILASMDERACSQAGVGGGARCFLETPEPIPESIAHVA